MAKNPRKHLLPENIRVLKEQCALYLEAERRNDGTPDFLKEAALKEYRKLDVQYCAFTNSAK